MDTALLPHSSARPFGAGVPACLPACLTCQLVIQQAVEQAYRGSHIMVANPPGLHCRQTRLVAYNPDNTLPVHLAGPQPGICGDPFQDRPSLNFSKSFYGYKGKVLQRHV